MADKKSDAVVTLIAPNGQTVSVAESKMDERLAGGYQLPEKPSKGRSRSAND